MLCLRTTPIDHNLPSPSELLYSRKLQSNLPILIQPHPTNTDINNKLRQRQQTQKKQYDKMARDLQPLQTGQLVQMQDDRGTWTPATVVEKRSYTIPTPNGAVYRRNRRHLRDLTNARRVTWADQNCAENVNSTSGPDRQPQHPMPVVTSPQPANQQCLRRSPRVSKPVHRLIENI